MTRVYLKKIVEMDLPLLWEKINETSSEWQKMNDPLNEQPIPSQMLFFSEVANNWVQDGNPLLIMLEKEMIGVVSWSEASLYNAHEKEEWIVDIGLIIFEAYTRGRGYGAEALLLLIDYLFVMLPCLKSITITTWSGNLPMIALAEKINIPLYSVKTKMITLDGADYDEIVYRLNRVEWEESTYEH